MQRLNQIKLCLQEKQDAMDKLLFFQSYHYYLLKSFLGRISAPYKTNTTNLCQVKSILSNQSLSVSIMQINTKTIKTYLVLTTRKNKTKH